jgi:hypothetical protein
MYGSIDLCYDLIDEHSASHRLTIYLFFRMNFVKIGYNKMILFLHIKSEFFVYFAND